EVAVALFDEVLRGHASHGAVIAIHDQVLASGMDEGADEIDHGHALLAEIPGVALVRAGGDHAIALEVGEPIRLGGGLAAVLEVELPIMPAAEARDTADEIPPVLGGGFDNDSDVAHGEGVELG